MIPLKKITIAAARRPPRSERQLMKLACVGWVQSWRGVCGYERDFSDLLQVWMCM